MTDVHNETPGVRGHTRSTWRDETHLRGLLLKLMTQNPDATRDELEAMYLAAAKKVPALVDEALRRAFDNDLAQIQKPATRSARHRVSETEIALAAEKLKTIVLLDLIQPNGKKLRDCTGEECRQAGGWLTAVGDRIGPDGIVGKQLSEAEVVGIFANSTPPEDAAPKPKGKRK